MNLFVSRIIRAARLDPNLYEEVEADRSSLSQAIIVIVASNIAAGIGSVAEITSIELISTTFGALVGWFLWALITYLLGAKVFPQSQTEADYGQLLRTIGFSSSPGIIRILGIIPEIRDPVFFIASLWMLVAMVIAVRQALDYTSTLRAVLVVLVGWILQIFVFGSLFLLLEPQVME
ncbi:YIP1 family protein [Chitinispirillales bacterium ANBcel5]|uniref:YIP1 family protein n=1 Tax=Cellulosispirillum alkaliphilum TaxID=3039283 RepID=UPI002A4E6C04|nr:YIP1 family protein [Chitinispirillales bacterium ANBcel5]